MRRGHEVEASVKEGGRRGSECKTEADDWLRPKQEAQQPSSSAGQNGGINKKIYKKKKTMDAADE